MATEVISSVRSSGGDYTSLSSWEAGEQGNLVSLDEIHTAECYNDWSGGLGDAVTVDGSTTDSTRYMVIRAASGQGHDGTPGTGFQLKNSTTGLAVTLELLDGYVRVENIEVRHDYSTSGSRGALKLYDNCTATNVLAKCLSTTGYAIYLQATSDSVYARAIGCLAFSCAGNGFTLQNRPLMQVLNCVAAGCVTGFSSSGANAFAKNCVSYNNTTNWSGSWSASSTNNATSTGSDDAPGASSVISVASSDFANAASNDFHLSSGSVLRGAGTNLYSTFATDIDGEMWPSSGAWDIGFDYYVSAAAASAVPRKAFPRAILNF